MKIRSPDPSCNQYAAIALILAAGFEGIENKTPLSPELDIDTFNAKSKELKNVKTLPETLPQALKLALQSDFVKRILPDVTLKAFANLEE